MNQVFRAIAAMAVLLAGCAGDVDPVKGVAEAQSLVSQGKAGEARILLKNLLSLHPDASGARVVLARIALDEGDAQAASDEMSALDAAELADPGALRVQVRVDIETGKPEVALARMKESGDSIPQPDRAVLLASVHRATGSPADALAVLRDVEATAGWSAALSPGIAASLASMGNMDLAIAELDKYLASAPADRADALRMRGEIHLRDGRPEDAARDFKAALDAASPGWPRVDRITTELLVVDALIAAGKVDSAKAQLAKVEKSWPGTFGAMVLQGQMALLEGRPEEAVEFLGAVMEAGAGNARIQFLLVEALMKTGNLARASELLEQLVAEEPVSSPSRRVLATLFMQQGRPDRVLEILGADAELGASDGQNTDDDLLAAARLARDHAMQAISVLSGKLAASPDDPKLRAELAAAQLANGEPTVALKTLGPFVEGRQHPLGVATRLSALYLAGNSIEANQVVDRLISTDAGSDLAVLLACSDAAAQRQQYAVVSRLLEKAAVTSPVSREVQMRQANLAFATRDYDKAAKILAAIMKADPANVGAQLVMARVAEARGNVVESRQLLEAAVKSHPDAVEPSLMLASLELRDSKPGTASAAIDRLIAVNKDAAAANAAGVLLARGGRYEEARTRFRQAIDRDQNNAEYWFNLGESQLALKDATAAKQSFVRSAGLKADFLRAGFAAIRLSVEQEDLDTARKLAQGLVASLPESATSWLLMGEVRAASGDMSGAVTAFARSYAIRASSLAATREFGARLAAGAQRPEEPLLKWLAREPADTVARHLLSDFLLVRGRDDEAREQLEIIVKQVPNDLSALNNLAWVLRVSSRDRAEALAKRARAIAPDNPAVADTLGVILLANGKTDEALAALEQAATGMPRDKTVQYHYAMSLGKSGQREKARGILAKVLKDPGDFPDKAAAQRLLVELG
jgi:cellulose synthase operon protein C